MSQIGTPLVGTYDYGEVARSILIAFLASYAALDLGGRVTAARGSVRAAWLTGGAIAMGVGIWAMHFKGMLAFQLPVKVAYHWPTVLASLLIAILASAIALYVATRQEMEPIQAWTGSLILGGGIAAMHYLGVAAMRLAAVTHLDPLVVTLSVVLAILFSRLALMFTFDYREDFRGTTLAKIISAAVMGVAISLMHYTGMAAASFIPAARLPDLSHTVSISRLGGYGISVVSLLVLGAAILTSSVDRQTQAQMRRLNESLEHRVVERTKQLTATNEELHREIAERRRAEDALQRSEDHLRLVLDTTPALIHSARPDGYVDYFNQRWLTYVGLPLEDLQGWGWAKSIHPEDLERISEKWRASLASGEPLVNESRLRRADGEYRWQLLRKVPLRDMQGNIVKWYGSVVDIEDRKRAEEERRRGETYLAMAQRMARMGVWSWNPSSGDMFGSEEFYRIFAISPAKAKLTREVFLQRIHPEDLPRYESGVNAAVAERRNWELDYRIVLPDGSLKYLHAIGKPVFDKSGDTLEFVGTTLDITERKRAEQGLRQAEERIRAILEYSPNLIFLKDAEGRYLLVNKEFERTLRVSQEQVKGKTDSDLFPPEQAAEFRAHDLQVLRAGLPMEFEETVLLEDGRHTSIVHKFPLFDTRGNIYATGGIVTDITERKRAEEARRYSEEQYRTVVETATDAVISIDEASQILFVNPAATKIFGYDTSELIGSPLTMLMPEFLRDSHKTGLRRYLTTNQRHLNWQGVELIGQRKNGEEFPVEVSFGEVTKQGRSIFTGFVRDITDRKQAEEALRSSVAQLVLERARLVEAQEVAKLGSWDLDLKTMDVSWSEQTHRIFETDPSHFRPTRPKFREFIHPQDRAKMDTALEAFLDKRSPSTVDYRIVMPDGRVKILEEHWQAFHDEEGKPARLAGTCRDVTERAQAEEELKRLSVKLLRLQDEERRRIARDLHDSTGQDLVALATMLGQLRGSVPSGERKPRRLLSECKTLADQCIRQIRTLSYVLHPPALDHAGLGDAIRDYVKGFTKRSGVQVELELAPRLGRMEQDIELALFRVVQESLANIQRHSGSPRAKIRIHRNLELTLEISDIGRGVSANNAQRGKEAPGFEVGVGIPSMRERVKLIGGQLEIDSTSHGTTVRVTIPLERNEREKSAHSGG
jgi:PAS domain S-box-containing protein